MKKKKDKKCRLKQCLPMLFSNSEQVPETADFSYCSSTQYQWFTFSSYAKMLKTINLIMGWTEAVTRGVFYKKGVLKFGKIYRKLLNWSLFLIKLQVSGQQLY